MLGTSDAWLKSHLFQRTSVLYCRLSDFKFHFIQIIEKYWKEHYMLKFEWGSESQNMIKFNVRALVISKGYLKNIESK